MKRIVSIIGIFATLICIVGSSLALVSCEDQGKYTYDKYEEITYGEHERQTLNLYLPRGREDTVGLILVIHGGGWCACDKKDCEKNLDKWCKAYGYATAAINYHYISDEFSCDDIMQDMALSLDKIREFAATKGYNIEKALLTGNSAGGHLSLLYAYKYADRASIRAVAVANYSGPTDLTDENYFVNNANASGYLDLFSKLCHTEFTEDNYLSTEMQSKMLEYSPISYINESTVPTLICHGDADDVVPYSNAVILKAQLDLYGVKSDFVSYRNSGHSLSGDKERSNEAKKLFGEYVKAYLE